MKTTDTLRSVRLEPYAAGRGPVFYLVTWDTGRADGRGQTIIGYRLQSRRSRLAPRPVTLFEGEDFAGSPLHADDSDATLAALLSFLTLRPGDTDAEFFANYTAEQLAFCAEHAEALGYEAERRFGRN